MNTYTVYYRDIDDNYCSDVHVDANNVEQAINKGLQYLEHEEHLDYSEIEICHVEKVVGNEMTPERLHLYIERLRNVNLYLNQTLPYDKRINIQNTISDVMDDLRNLLE